MRRRCGESGNTAASGAPSLSQGALSGETHVEIDPGRVSRGLPRWARRLRPKHDDDGIYDVGKHDLFFAAGGHLNVHEHGHLNRDRLDDDPEHDDPEHDDAKHDDVSVNVAFA